MPLHNNGQLDLDLSVPCRGANNWSIYSSRAEKSRFSAWQSFANERWASCSSLSACIAVSTCAAATVHPNSSSSRDAIARLASAPWRHRKSCIWQGPSDRYVSPRLASGQVDWQRNEQNDDRRDCFAHGDSDARIEFVSSYCQRRPFGRGRWPRIKRRYSRRLLRTTTKKIRPALIRQNKRA